MSSSAEERLRIPKAELSWVERLWIGLHSSRSRRRELRARIRWERQLFADHFCVPYWKFLSMESRHGRIATLIVGSSHAYYGFQAEADEFNLADVSCDLRRVYQSVDFWLAKGMPALRRVILFYDVFSPGNVLERSRERFRLIPYSELYGFSGDYGGDETNVILGCGELKKAFRREIRRHRPSLGSEYRGNFGYGCTPYRCPDEELAHRVVQHIKLSEGRECVWIEKLHNRLSTAGVELVLVIPPLRSDYRALLPANREDLLSSLRRDVPGLSGIKVLDFLDSDEFNAADFNDMDHLNASGARKLSAAIRSSL